MKNTFYFTLKGLFDLKIFKFLFWFFGLVEKLPEQKDKVNLKNYDFPTQEKIQLMYTYCPISEEVKVIIQLNLVS